MEVMRWSGMEGIYGPTLRSTDVYGNGNEKRWEDLHMRSIEHVGISANGFRNPILKHSTEHTNCSQILHTHHCEALNVSSGFNTSRNRRDVGSIGRIKDNMGEN